MDSSIFVPQPQDMVTPAMNLYKLMQQKKEFELEQQKQGSLQDYHKQMGLQNKIQNIISLAKDQPEAAAQMFNSDPEMVQRNKGPIKFTGTEGNWHVYEGGDAVYKIDSKSGKMVKTEIAGKEPELPYKRGARTTFTGQDGKTYEGTFQGINPETKEPIFTGITGKQENVPSALDEFETVTGVSPELRGSEGYRKKYMDWLSKKKETTVIKEMNPYQIAQTANSLRTEIRQNPYIKDYQDVSQKYGVMLEAMKESKTTKNFVAIDQALITLFNKMTDPQSVVRESEYIRTTDDLSLWNRMKGKIERMAAGGPGLTQEDRQALINMAGKFYDVYSDNYDNTISDYEQLAEKTGIDSELIGIPYRRPKVTFGEPSIQPEEKDKELSRGIPTEILTGTPKGIPEGSTLIGTKNGRPVYKTPDGRKLVVE